MKVYLFSFFLLFIPLPSEAFCGFYVAQGGATLFNKASKVVMVHSGDRHVLTMVNDFEGEADQFAFVIPVPTVLEKEQIHIGNQATVEHLDTYSAPRLVEYHDENPCAPQPRMEAMAAAPQEGGGAERRLKELGVTIEAQYTIGEYDIIILSAEQSQGLEMWLRKNKYTIPQGASEVLGSYLKQGMKFFVAKVNLEEHKKLGYSFLRPIQIAFNSPKFMLPIRLGTVNAKGTQDLFLFTITQNGRVETTNYRTVRLPDAPNIPLFIKDDFSRFYQDHFTHLYEKEGKNAVFLEYAWDMSSCDPCSSAPLSPAELKELGVFWTAPPSMPLGGWAGSSQPRTFLTRLHVRYDKEHFPEDLMLQETGDSSFFQGRYVLRHPWTGGDSCPAAEQYKKTLQTRKEEEVRTLLSLTGWSPDSVQEKAAKAGYGKIPTEEKWWKTLW